MQKIIPNLWFDSQAEEAAMFYTSLFKNSKIGKIARYGKEGFEIHGQPEGKVMTIQFELEGQAFSALNGGPIFSFTPAISFLVACQTKEEVNALWKELSAGGSALMELGTYPFSEWYGWTKDRYGLSWQIMYMGDRPVKQKIIPTLMFVGEQYGKAEPAVKLYTSVFHQSAIDHMMRYEQGEEPLQAGTIKHAGFTLEGQEFAVMDGAGPHAFGFTEAISLMIMCDTQAEIDEYWNALTKGGDPKAQQCGWLKDQFGVSWQVVPTVLEKMMEDADKQKSGRVMNAFLKMKKFDIAELQKAYEGNS